MRHCGQRVIGKRIFPIRFPRERILRKPEGFLKERSDPQLEQTVACDIAVKGLYSGGKQQNIKIKKKRQLVFGASFLFFILIFARYGLSAAGKSRFVFITGLLITFDIRNIFYAKRLFLPPFLKNGNEADFLVDNKGRLFLPKIS